MENLGQFAYFARTEKAMSKEKWPIHEDELILFFAKF
jgi:hypothetical protein